MTFHLLHTQGLSIFEQLKLEEALLRADERNWCLINEGSSPAIVMGISGKKEELVNEAKIAHSPVPVIKRFSGGGTVIVDEETLFITFICNKEIHAFPAYPEPILKWTYDLYRSALGHEQFLLKENDYAMGEKKCGGNAQYIKKERWLHHTSFLWDYRSERMEYLLMPKKRPAYRADRTHDDFLCKLSDYFPSKTAWLEQIKAELSKRYAIEPVSLGELLISQDHRQTTCLI
jgi:lipoate-protein ligase A